jgi:hypothetical protein
MTICGLCHRRIRFWQQRFVSVFFAAGKPVHTDCADRALLSCESAERLADLEQQYKREGRVDELEMLYRAFPPEAQP